MTEKILDKFNEIKANAAKGDINAVELYLKYLSMFSEDETATIKSFTDSGNITDIENFNGQKRETLIKFMRFLTTAAPQPDSPSNPKQMPTGEMLSSLPLENGIDYVRERLDRSIDFHSRAASTSKRKFLNKKITVTIFSSLVTLFIALTPIFPSEYHVCEIVALVCSAVVTYFTIVNKVEQNKEDWINYRRITDLLKSERYLYCMKAGDYADNNRDRLLALRVENIIQSASENFFNRKINIHDENQKKE